MLLPEAMRICHVRRYVHWLASLQVADLDGCVYKQSRTTFCGKRNLQSIVLPSHALMQAVAGNLQPCSAPVQHEYGGERDAA